jgi:hypothetical protein
MTNRYAKNFKKNPCRSQILVVNIQYRTRSYFHVQILKTPDSTKKPGLAGLILDVW